MKKSVLTLFVAAFLLSANTTQAACPNSGFLKIAAACASITIASFSYGAWETHKDERFFRTCRPELNQGDRQRFAWKFTQEGDIANEFLDQPRCADALQVLGHFGGSSNSKVIAAGLIGGPTLIVAAASLITFTLKTLIVDPMTERWKHKKA